MAQDNTRQLGDGARHLDARWTAAYHDECEKATPCLRIIGRLGILEGRQDTPADAGCIIDLLQAGSHALPFIAAKIRMPRAGCEYKSVIGDFAIFDYDDTAVLIRAAHPAGGYPANAVFADGWP